MASKKINRSRLSHGLDERMAERGGRGELRPSNYVKLHRKLEQLTPTHPRLNRTAEKKQYGGDASTRLYETKAPVLRLYIPRKKALYSLLSVFSPRVAKPGKIVRSNLGPVLGDVIGVLQPLAV